ncbi:TlpA disulfide reductase family protein [Neisseria leonii]|uniref:TlpA disulfide reductase family protein n=1 Tax=Neisseria leonii TaxID=2995413 RepID=A0A9X4E6B6_9NEIS|nr:MULTISPECIES: TlpA disulfide reductase family protein [unclassified Neisseria]MDD9326542.1 TlpA family protein disulfide reductase [Neisseria sp. 3986]MDD9328651.1 TlpA family protein disulfide reductase [Neisseria sp. 51.81]
MKTLLAALLAAALPAAASELVSFPDNRPQQRSQTGAPVTVINLWAAWCAPCRKEMPLMSAWYAKQPKGSVALIGIALDSEANIARFLRTTPVNYPVWRYTGNDSRAWMNALGNTVGGIPYTLIEARNCSFKHSITGEVDGKKLDEAVKLVRSRCKTARR